MKNNAYLHFGFNSFDDLIKDIPVLEIEEARSFLDSLLNKGLIRLIEIEKDNEISYRLETLRGKLDQVSKLFNESSLSSQFKEWHKFTIFFNSKWPLKYCRECGKLLLKPLINKSGLCGECSKFKEGKDNIIHIVGVTGETRQKIGAAVRAAWQTPEYRNKVINNATGKKRSDEFKEKQRQNAFKQFQNPNQRLIRSTSMKNAWKTGKMKNSMARPSSYNRSKKEKNLFSALASLLNISYNEESLFSIKYKDEENNKKWLYPDFIYNKIIIEYNGKYWHCMPDYYTADFKLHTGASAQEIWENDAHKREIYLKEGYSVLTIWKTFVNPNKKDKNYFTEKLNLILEKIKEIEIFQKENSLQGLFELK